MIGRDVTGDRFEDPRRRAETGVPLVCVGEVYTDLVFTGLQEPAVPGREVTAQMFRMDPGGGAVISAVALARLGGNVHLVGCAGDNPLCRVALERLAQEGVGLDGVEQVPGKGPNLTVAISEYAPELADAGPDSSAPARVRDRMMVTYRGVGASIPVERLEEVLTRLSKEFPPGGSGASRAGPSTPGPCHVHLAGGRADDIDTIAGIAREHGASLSLDAGWEAVTTGREQLLQHLHLLDVFFCNELEAQQLTGARSADEALKLLASRAPLAIVKAGPRGALARTSSPPASGSAAGPAAHQELVYVPVPGAVARTAVVDTTGAGDAFCGGFLHGFVRCWPLKMCVQLGALVGTLSTRAPGGIAALPRLPDVCALFPELGNRVSQSGTDTYPMFT